jgi:hypothetical protein
MSKKDKNAPSFVNLAVPMYKTELEDFRAYCETINTDPRTVVYSFIRAVLDGEISVTPPSSAPFTQ